MKKKLTEIKGKTDKSAIIVGDFNTFLSLIELVAKKKSARE